MIRTPFNDDWRVRPKANAFAELMGGGGQPWVPVQLPHDAMIGATRDPAEEPANGYFPGGVWEYQKTFTAPEADRGKQVLIEFEGVYRGARVSVNGTLVGHRPYGYSNFAVSIGEHLRYGADNTNSSCTDPAISNLYTSKSSTVEAIPPAYSLKSRHSVRSPAFWSSAAAVSPLWPAQTTIA